MKQRLIWADSLKGWLMILVILGHAIQTVMLEDCNNDHVWNIIYSFHMPTFMAVSGWFAYRQKQNGGGKNVCLRRCKQLLVPYLMWSLISYGLSGDYNMERLSKMVLYPDAYFWFLWVLFLINLLFVLCQNISYRIHIDELTAICIMCLSLFGVMVAFEIRMFGFQFFSYYFIFYTFGYCIHRFKWLQVSNKMYIAVLFIIWAILAWYWSMHSLPSWMPAIPHVPSTLMQYAYRGLTAAIAILVIFGFAPNTLNKTDRTNLIMKELGTVSLGLYVCHLTIIGYVVEVIRHYFPQTDNSIIIIFNFVISTIISVIIVELLKRNKITAEILLGKI